MRLPRPIRFCTRDPEEFVEQLRPVTPPFFVLPTSTNFDLNAKMIELPHLGLFIADLRHAHVKAESLRGTIGVNIPLCGEAVFKMDGQVHTVGPGFAFVAAPDVPFDMTIGQDSPVLVANIDAELLRAHWCDNDETLPVVGGRFPLSSQAGAQLFRTVSCLWGDLLRGGSEEPSTEELRYELVEALALLGAEPRRVAGRKQIRNAEGFVRDKLDQRISVLDIAEAAGVSARTLHRAFLEEHGLTPMGYVRRERLAQARRALLAADPREATVSCAAQSSGFMHLGRFSIAYREAFGESPSQTLRN